MSLFYSFLEIKDQFMNEIYCLVEIHNDTAGCKKIDSGDSDKLKSNYNFRIDHEFELLVSCDDLG